MKFRYILLLILIAASVYAVYLARQQPYENPVDLRHVPTFSEVELAFEHDYEQDRSLPFAAAAVIDIQGDGTPEVFLGGGHLQRDALFAFREGRFENLGPDRGLGKAAGDATYAAASVDVNRDGLVDLFVARDSGLYLYYNQNGFFEKRDLGVDFADHEVPVAIALGDINNDDRIDLFVSCLPARKHQGRLVLSAPELHASGKLLLNRGNNRFKDITERAGLTRPHGSFSAVFTELNGDEWIDLVVTYQQAPAAVYQNLDGERFESRPYPGSEATGFATGAAVGDINDDGRSDILLTGAGASVPYFLIDPEAGAGPRTRWSLLRNEGGFDFTDTADARKVAAYEQAWGAAFADFNLNGRQDIVAAQNLRGYPPHWLFKNPGRLLVQKDDGSFGATETTAGAENRHYGITPLVGDFNDDGYPDLIWVNVGGPARALLNNGGNARYVKVDLGDNPAALGATVHLETGDGRRFSRQHIADTGLGADHSAVGVFGIGPQAGIDSLEIRYLSGKTLVLDKPPLNRTLSFKPEAASIPAAPPPAPAAEPEPADSRPQTAPETQEPAAPAEDDDAGEPETSVEDELETLLGR